MRKLKVTETALTDIFRKAGELKPNEYIVAMDINPLEGFLRLEIAEGDPE